jgi:hypothetical protein
MKTEFDRSKTLEELDGRDWGEPKYDSYLVGNIHRLRRKPLEEFTVEELRVMIGQNIGLSYLIPIAVERLEENPLASGDFYSGDLLNAVLSVDPGFWQMHPEHSWKVEEILSELESLRDTIEKIIIPAAESFRRAIT